MPIITPRVLVELNGADPVNIVTNLPGIQVDTLDWDEIRAGWIRNEDLIAIHDRWEDKSPRTARSIRDVLRERNFPLPSQYDKETTA